MRITKLVLSTFAMLALSATAASAQIEMLDEDDSEPCSEVKTVANHVVEGGCDIEVQSEHHISVAAQTPFGPVVIYACNWHLDARIGSDGLGYITEAQFTNEPQSSACTRAPCDEADGTMLPWPLRITEVAPGDEVFEFAFCFRTVVSGPGASGVTCWVHLPLTDNGNHNYEMGDSTTYSCESVAGQIQDVHLVGESDSVESIEIVH